MTQQPESTGRPSASTRSVASTSSANGGGFVDAVLAVVADIPPGRVATYGDVAALLGSRGARAVGQVMARYGSDVAWWRVVRAGGHPPTCHAGMARAHYEDEGIPLRPTQDADGYRIDLAASRWRP